ncbi:MAG: hypothetical protein IJP31_11755 [Lachnospiraceae bacterium]|nr:hypothetical protein [Lachnospiraceae bacterium]
MKKFAKTAAAFLLGVSIMASVKEALPVHAGGLGPASVYFACGVPIPESAPGEEKRDIITGLIGLCTLTAIVSGGLLILQKKNPDKAQ